MSTSDYDGSSSYDKVVDDRHTSRTTRGAGNAMRFVNVPSADDDDDDGKRMLDDLSSGKHRQTFCAKRFATVLLPAA